MVINQVIYRLRAQNFREGLPVQQLVVHPLRLKTKQFPPRLLRRKVARSHFFVYRALAGIRDPNLSEQLQRLLLKRQELIRHLVQVLRLQKVLRELVAHVPRPVQAKFPVQTKQFKVDVSVRMTIEKSSIVWRR